MVIGRNGKLLCTAAVLYLDLIRFRAKDMVKFVFKGLFDVLGVAEVNLLVRLDLHTLWARGFLLWCHWANAQVDFNSLLLGRGCALLL